MKVYFIKKIIYTIGVVTLIILLSGWASIMLWGDDYSINKTMMKSIFRIAFIAGTIYLLEKEKLINWQYTYKNSIWCLIGSLGLIYLSWQNYSTEATELKVKVPVFEHGVYIFNCLTTGFFEEYFFRVLIFAYFCKAFPQGNFKPLIWTSLIFGAVHFTGYLTGIIDLASVINQVVFGFFIGMILQSIFFRFNNIFIGSILHAVINYNGMIKQGLFRIQSQVENEGSFEDFIISLAVFTLIGLVIAIPIVYFSLKNRQNLLILKE